MSSTDVACPTKATIACCTTSRRSIRPMSHTPGQRPLTMVVPTYNERDQLDTLIEQIFAECDAYGIDVEVVIVDDNSPDGTGARADWWTRRGRVRVVHRPGKLGLGSAVQAGFATCDS